jgi:hypothetical protein
MACIPAAAHQHLTPCLSLNPSSALPHGGLSLRVSQFVSRSRAGGAEHARRLAANSGKLERGIPLGIKIYCHFPKSAAYWGTAMTARATETSRACPVSPAATPSALAWRAAANWALLRALSGLWPGTRAPGGKPGLAAGVGAGLKERFGRAARDIVSSIGFLYSLCCSKHYKRSPAAAAAAARVAVGGIVHGGGAEHSGCGGR